MGIAAPSFQISKPSVGSALNGELRKNSGANAPTQGRKPPSAKKSSRPRVKTLRQAGART
jgi:hypothetical protein